MKKKPNGSVVSRIFCLVFSLLCSVGQSISETNIGAVADSIDAASVQPEAETNNISEAFTHSKIIASPGEETGESEEISRGEYYWRNVVNSGRDFIVDHVEVGLALNFYSLVEGKRSSNDTFLGTIDELKLKTGVLSINSLRVQFLLPQDFRIEVGYSDFEYETRTIEDDSDGTFSLSGLRVIALYRPNFHEIIKPVIGIGVARNKASFDPEKAFFNGFSGDNKYEKYQNWVDAGSEPWPNNGYRKNIEPDSTVWALYLRLGLDINYFKNWVLGLDYEYIRQDIQADYVLSNYDIPFRVTPDIDFPASTHVFSIYARYDF